MRNGLVFFLLSFILCLFLFSGCDTSNESDPSGRWFWSDLEEGVGYSQSLLLVSDNSYAWEFFEDSEKKDLLSTTGTYAVVVVKKSKVIEFTPELGEPFARNFMVSDGGLSLLMAVDQDGTFLVTPFSLLPDSSDKVEEVVE